MAMLPHFQKTTFELPEKQAGQAVPFSLISMKRFLMPPLGVEVLLWVENYFILYLQELNTGSTSICR